MRTFLIIQFKSTTSLEFFILSSSFSYLYKFYHIKCYYFTHLLGMLDISSHPNIRSITKENFAELFNLYIPIFTVFNLVNVYTQLTLINIWISSVQSLSCVQLFVTPWTAAHQPSLSITSYWSPPKSMSIVLVMPSNHLILCHPLPLLPSVFPSIRIFSNEWALRIRWPKYWSFNFKNSPTYEHPGLISFRMDWLDLLAVQGTLKSPLQHDSSKASSLQRSAFFIVQLSHPYMTTGKNITLTRWTFVDKVMSLISNILSRLVITFLTRN